MSMILLACRQGMYDQPKFTPLQENSFYPDRQSSRPLPPGTLPISADLSTTLTTWRGAGGKLVETMPVALTPALLERGHERYEIYCAPCHDRLGHGTGMIVRRGFPNATSYHLERLVNAPDGYFYEVMTNGYGLMYDYASRVQPADRWAITAYIRVLQYSQNARREDVPADRLKELEGVKP